MVALASSSSSLLYSPCVNFLGQKQLAFDNTNVAVPLSQVASVRFRTPRISASYTTSERTRPLHSSSIMASSASLYEVLGLSTGATLPEIKSAYRKLARVCHPDVVAIDRKDSSANEFKKIYAAYSTLSDPEKRAEYDRNLFVGQRTYRSPPYSASSYASASSPMSGFSGTGRRTWETDQCW